MNLRSTNTFCRLLLLLIAMAAAGNSFGQCDFYTSPTYSRSPNATLNDHFTSITATGPGVVSTIGITTDTTEDHIILAGTQGVTVPMGSPLNINITRSTSFYTAYLSVYLDWNMDGALDSNTELVGSVYEIPSGTSSVTYNFTVPVCSVAVGTNVLMRVMLSEVTGNHGAPCTGNYGQAYDFAYTASCPVPSTLSISPSVVNICPSTEIYLTASGAPSGVPYSWAPSSAISSSYDAYAVTSPAVTTVYTVSATVCGGCTTTATATVNVVTPPGPVGGPTEVCIGNNIALTNTVSGGTWFSDNPVVATVDEATGVVHGVSLGTANIIYIMGIGEGCSASITVSVGSPPGAITGSTAPVCAFTDVPFSDPVPGGVWSSSNPAIASVSSAGIVTANATGTATISYTTPGCPSVITPFTVKISPTPIVGPSTVCEGADVTMTSTSGGYGGHWTSSIDWAASVGYTTGVVHGMPGPSLPVTISFTVYDCSAHKDIWVVTSGSLSGSLTGCVGNTSTITRSVAAGDVPPTPVPTWTSGNVSLATVTGTASTGIVTPVAAGTVLISYSAYGCAPATAVFTVYPAPAEVTGPSSVCMGSTITMAAGTGGTWVSGNTAVADITSAGVVTGDAPGTSTISYIFPITGCVSKKVITVGAIPVISPNPGVVCVGLTSTLTSSVPGGTWLSADVSYATITSGGGVLTGIHTGTVTITYTSPLGCVGTGPVNVGGIPVISNSTSTYTVTCGNPYLPLDVNISGGYWFSGSPSLASVDHSTGVVGGISPGVAVISYSSPLGCIGSHAVTVVNPVISGPPTARCGSGSPIVNLIANIGSGTWTSSNTYVATVVSSSSTGYVYGVAAGAVVITYALSPTCIAYDPMTIVLPPVSGLTNICVGATTTLSAGFVSGTWASYDPGIASVSSGGLVTGLSGGTASIVFNAGPGCVVSTPVSVQAPVITSPTGSFDICSAGFTLALSANVLGGTWSCSSPNASVSSTGVVTASNPGTAIVSYTTPLGCIATKILNILPMVSIGGPHAVCLGSTITMIGGPSGGYWTSSSYATAPVNSLGVVTGTLAGSAVITYSASGYCSAIWSVTVSDPSISPADPICVGSTEVLTGSPSGGTWSSSSGDVSINTSTGEAHGNHGGGSYITYTYPAGCQTTKYVAALDAPGAACWDSGSDLRVDVGHTTTIWVQTPGGTWYSGTMLAAEMPISEQEDIFSWCGFTTCHKGVIHGLEASTWLPIIYVAPNGCSKTWGLAVW